MFSLSFRGYLGPGGLDEHGQHVNCTGGAAGYIDRKVFGDSHIYQNPTCKVSPVTEMLWLSLGCAGKCQDSY